MSLFEAVRVQCIDNDELADLEKGVQLGSDLCLQPLV